jgi:RNA recognition motif-containing protein
MSIRLYVGNLPKDVVEKQSLTEFFADAGENASTKVIKDRKTGKCRGFAFVTVPTDEEADAFIEKYNGQSFMDSELKIEKALPRTKADEKEEGAVSSHAAPTKAGGAKRKRPAGGGGGGGKKPVSYSSDNSGAPQPDPRWASELEKLKDMLQKQTTNV